MVMHEPSQMVITALRLIMSSNGSFCVIMFPILDERKYVQSCTGIALAPTETTIS